MTLHHSVFICVLPLLVLATCAWAKSGPTYYTPERIATARENVEKYDWARGTLNTIMKGQRQTYIIGRQYYGVKQGGNFAAASTIGFSKVDEPNVITYQGGADAAVQIDQLSVGGGNVTLVWDSVEGGNYTVESSADLVDWTTQPPVQADGAAFETQATVPAADPAKSFHRVRSDGVNTYDVNPTP